MAKIGFLVKTRQKIFVKNEDFGENWIFWSK